MNLKQTVASGLAAMCFLTSTAYADTNAVFMNATSGTVNLGGKRIAPQSGSYTTLWGVTGVLANGKTFELKDDSKRCAGDSGWAISARGNALKAPVTYCIELGFAEVGCVYIVVAEDRDPQNAPLGTYTAAISKAAGHSCSDNWWSDNKDDVWKGIENGLKYQSNAASVLESVVSLVSP